MNTASALVTVHCMLVTREEVANDNSAPNFEPNIDTEEPKAVDPLHTVIVRAAAGDKNALEALVRAFDDILVGLASVALEPFEDEAEDVVQEFYLMLLDGSVRSRPTPQGAVVWMLEVVRSIARARREKLRRRWGLERGPR